MQLCWERWLPDLLITLHVKRGLRQKRNNNTKYEIGSILYLFHDTEFVDKLIDEQNVNIIMSLLICELKTIL